MKHPNFIGKIICAVIIGIVLFRYQAVADARADEAAQRETEIAEAEEYNKEIKAANAEAKRAADEAAGLEAEKEEEEEGLYINGEYTGTGVGYGGNISVSVTVEDGEISDIEVTEHSTEDPAYFLLVEGMTDTMIEEQTWEVDTVSGATFSSNGLISAVENALSEAVNQ